MNTKTKPPAGSPRLRWQGVLMVSFTGLFLAAWGVGWIYVRGRLDGQKDYVLSAEQVSLTPPPPWVRSDVKSEVLRDASLDRPQSILDDQLTRRIHERFPLHPWIARVERVTAHYPARVTVEVVYRRPVCMVEVPGGVYPVDEQSVLLPSGDFSPIDTSRYPLLRGIDTRPGPAGQPWGDPRVLEGCRLAVALAEVWLELQLASLAPLAANEEDAPQPTRFVLMTRSGVQVLWGQPPEPTAAGRILVAAKIGKLRQVLGEAPTGNPLRTITLESLDAR